MHADLDLREVSMASALAWGWGWGWDQCWQSLDGVPEPLVPNSRQSGQSASGVDLLMD